MTFTKYSCQGNDFVLYNSLRPSGPEIKFSNAQVQFLCDRKMGIGADGILLLRESSAADFRMVYFNADGNEVEMCGNGARACVHAFSLAQKLPPETRVEFETMNGLYRGRMHQDNDVSVSMNEVDQIDSKRLQDLNAQMQAKSSFFIQVGVPHSLFELESVRGFELEKLAPQIRRDPRFKSGTNVSVFAFNSDGDIQLRTFERGVEAETLACGTAATAVACIAQKVYQKSLPQRVHAPGGVLTIDFSQGEYSLRGHVSEVFQVKFTQASHTRLMELQ